MDYSLSHKKRSRVDSFDPAEYDSLTESTSFDPTKVKKIKDDLLSLLDDSDTVPELSHDLDSVIRSFEEEISGSGSNSPAPDPVTVVDLTSDSGETLPEFGEFYGGEMTRVSSKSSGVGELWEFEDGLPSYDPFGFGLDYEQDFVAGDIDNHGTENEYVALDGIFDYSDVVFGSDFSWRSEKLPAL